VVACLVALALLSVPIGHVLLGGAIVGVVLGIAAQQSLGNVFAGLVLLAARPFAVGSLIRVRSGALGGEFHGTVLAMSLTYVSISTPEGKLQVPNSSVLAAAVGPATAAVLMMGPSMPTGLVLGDSHWSALAAALENHPAWLIYDAAMERIRFDGRPPSHPAAHPGLAGRTITVGSASKELRMIGWRVGWVVGPAPVLTDVNLVGLTNVVCQVGIAQAAVAAALADPGADADVAAATATWQQRCEVILDQLAGYPAVRPDGGWSLLIDTGPLGLTPGEASRLLFDRGKVAATPMDGWGPSGARYLRLVFANEPAGRLADLGDRFRRGLG